MTNLRQEYFGLVADNKESQLKPIHTQKLIGLLQQKVGQRVLKRQDDIDFSQSYYQKDASFQKNQFPGPQDYNPQKAILQKAFSFQREKRDQRNFGSKEQSPSPQKYNTIDTNLIRPRKTFNIKFPTEQRKFLPLGGVDNPGIGMYNLRTEISQSKQSFFKSKRFNESQNFEKTQQFSPGVGQYSIQKSLADPNKSISFSKQTRTLLNISSEEGPGVGQYNLSSSNNNSYNKYKTITFPKGPKLDTLNSKEKINYPGPMDYQIKSKFQSQQQYNSNQFFYPSHKKNTRSEGNFNPFLMAPLDNNNKNQNQNNSSFIKQNVQGKNKFILNSDSIKFIPQQQN